jgi:hypothetical protein
MRKIAKKQMQKMCKEMMTDVMGAIECFDVLLAGICNVSPSDVRADTQKCIDLKIQRLGKVDTAPQEKKKEIKHVTFQKSMISQSSGTKTHRSIGVSTESDFEGAVEVFEAGKKSVGVGTDPISEQELKKRNKGAPKSTTESNSTTESKPTTSNPTDLETKKTKKTKSKPVSLDSVNSTEPDEMHISFEQKKNKKRKTMQVQEPESVAVTVESVESVTVEPVESKDQESKEEPKKKRKITKPKVTGCADKENASEPKKKRTRNTKQKQVNGTASDAIKNKLSKREKTPDFPGFQMSSDSE